MGRSLFSGSDTPTVFFFEDGQAAGNTRRLVYSGDDGHGSVLAERFCLVKNDSIRERMVFASINEAHVWISEGIGGDDALDAFYAQPIADPPPAPPVAAKPPRTKKAPASA